MINIVGVRLGLSSFPRELVWMRKKMKSDRSLSSHANLSLNQRGKSGIDCLCSWICWLSDPKHDGLVHQCKSPRFVVTRENWTKNNKRDDDDDDDVLKTHWTVWRDRVFAQLFSSSVENDPLNRTIEICRNLMQEIVLNGRVLFSIDIRADSLVKKERDRNHDRKKTKERTLVKAKKRERSLETKLFIAWHNDERRGRMTEEQTSSRNHRLLSARESKGKQDKVLSRQLTPVKITKREEGEENDEERKESILLLCLFPFVNDPSKLEIMTRTNNRRKNEDVEKTSFFLSSWSR